MGFSSFFFFTNAGDCPNEFILFSLQAHAQTMVNAEFYKPSKYSHNEYISFRKQLLVV